MQKLSELKIISTFASDGYVAGMAAKIAADRAGAITSRQLGETLAVTYQKLTTAGSAAERMSRAYIDGYGHVARFDAEVAKLGREMERGNLGMVQASAILDGIQRKFSMTAEATKVASAGFLSLAKVANDVNAAAKPERFTGSATAQASLADVTALNAKAKALDDLRAKYAPLYAVERAYHQELSGITEAYRTGAITQAEMTQAALQAEVAFKSQVTALTRANTALSQHRANAVLSASAMQNLGYQINDIVTMAAMGYNPMMILTSQAGQLYQVLSMGQGGVGASLRYVGGMLTGLLTPMNLAVVAAGGFAATSLAASESWKSAQRDINLALIGVGSAAGVTASDINTIALAATETGRTTVGEARAMALAFASTGRIGADIAGQLTSLAPVVARVFGEDGPAAAQRLARAFEDPVRGIGDLNKRLLAFDAATVQNVQSLARQGHQFEAQQVLIKGLQNATKAAAIETSGWAEVWGRLTAKASEYWDVVGNRVAVRMGGGTPEQKLQELQDQLAVAAQQNKVGGDPDYINRLIKQVNERADTMLAELTATKERFEKTLQAAASQRFTDLVQEADPAIARIRQLKDELAGLQAITSDPKNQNGVPADVLAGQERAVLLKREEVQTEELRRASFMSSTDIAKQDAEFQLQAISARTAASQADVAYLQTRARLLRDGDINADIKAEGERQRIIAEGERRISDEIRSRNYAAGASIEAAYLEQSLVGKTADEAARLRAEYQAVAAVKAQAFSEFRTPSLDELDRARSSAADKVQIESSTRRQQILADLDFERAQIGRSSAEQGVYSRMRSIGYLQNGEIPAQNQYIADRLRLNDAIQRSVEAQKEFGASLIKDLIAGKSAAEALGGALDKLASRMLDSALDKGFSALLDTGGKGGFGGLFANLFHDGGTAGDIVSGRMVPPALFAHAPRYHGGGVAGLKPNEVPAILERGERILTRKQMAAARSQAQAASDPSVTVHVHIDASGAYPESIEQIKKAVTDMPRAIMRAMAEARNRGIG